MPKSFTLAVVFIRAIPSGSFLRLRQKSLLALRALSLSPLELLQNGVKVTYDFLGFLVISPVRGQLLHRSRGFFRHAPDGFPLSVEFLPKLSGVLTRAQRINHPLERTHVGGHLENQPAELLRFLR